jgi:hypothetical protein
VTTTAARYRTFADETHGLSPCFEEWSLAVAADPDVLALIDTLPEPKRQPNLVFAAARVKGAEPGPYSGLRSVLLSRWDDVRELVLARRTQTNEAGRCAPLLPLLAQLQTPLALLEVGAAAGLCLYPDRYSYRYDGRSVDPAAGPSPARLDCAVAGSPPIPSRLPKVAWRAGIDLNPLDVRDEDSMRWLQTRPEHEHRRRRLAAAISVVREDPPRIVSGDLNDRLVALAAEAPPEATLVVFHTAVLWYTSPSDRERFVHTVMGLPGHWISNESPDVLPEVAATAARSSSYTGLANLVAIDGRAKAWAGPHGEFLDWI